MSATTTKEEQAKAFECRQTIADLGNMGLRVGDACPLCEMKIEMHRGVGDSAKATAEAFTEDAQIRANPQLSDVRNTKPILRAMEKKKKEDLKAYFETRVDEGTLDPFVCIVYTWLVYDDTHPERLSQILASEPGDWVRAHNAFVRDDLGSDFAILAGRGDFHSLPHPLLPHKCSDFLVANETTVKALASVAVEGGGPKTPFAFRNLEIEGGAVHAPIVFKGQDGGLHQHPEMATDVSILDDKIAALATNLASLQKVMTTVKRGQTHLKKDVATTKKMVKKKVHGGDDEESNDNYSSSHLCESEESPSPLCVFSRNATNGKVVGGNLRSQLSAHDLDRALSSLPCAMSAMAFYDFRTETSTRRRAQLAAEFVRDLDLKAAKFGCAFAPLHVRKHWCGLLRTPSTTLILDSAPSKTTRSDLEALFRELGVPCVIASPFLQRRGSEECGLFCLLGAYLLMACPAFFPCATSVPSAPLILWKWREMLATQPSPSKERIREMISALELPTWTSSTVVGGGDGEEVRKALGVGDVFRLRWHYEDEEDTATWYGKVLQASDRRHKCYYFAALKEGAPAYLTHDDGEPWVHVSYLGATQDIVAKEITLVKELAQPERQEVEKLLATWEVSPDPAELWFAERNAPPRTSQEIDTVSEVSESDEEEEPRADAQQAVGALQDEAAKRTTDEETASLYRLLNPGEDVYYTLRHRVSGAIKHYEGVVHEAPRGGVARVRCGGFIYPLPSAGFVVSRIFRPGQGLSPPLSDPRLGSAEVDNVPLLCRHLTVKTMVDHCSLINGILREMRSTGEINLAEAACQYLTRKQMQEGWVPSTLLTRMGLTMGAFRRLQLYLPLAPTSPDLNASLFWRETLATVKKIGQRTPRRVPRAATKAVIRSVIAALPPQGALLLSLAWATGARPRCVTKLLRSDVRLGPENEKVSVFYRDHKTIGRVGPYLVPTTLPVGEMTALKSALQESTATKLFDLSGSEVDRLITAVGKALKQHHLEWRSVRRGSLQLIAKTELEDELILRISNHTNLRQLTEYLEGRPSAHTEKRLFEATAALC